MTRDRVTYVVGVDLGTLSGRPRAACRRTGCSLQVHADVTRLPSSVTGSEQGPALGSALHAAVAAGAYADIRAAAAATGSRRRELRGNQAYHRLAARL